MSFVLNLLIVSCLWVTVSDAASCCNGGPKTTEAFVAGVKEMDELHRIWLGKKILDGLHMANVPEYVSRVKKPKLNANLTDNEEISQRVKRKYTLTVIGAKIGSARLSRGDKCSLRYLFNANLPTVDGDVRTTQMRRAIVELPQDAMLVLHIQSENGSESETIDVHHLDVDVMEGRRRRVDVSPLVFPFWSPKRGLSMSVTVSGHLLCQSDIDVETILKLDVEEELTPPRHRKRHLSKSNLKRDSMINDCETAWDPEFLNNISSTMYDNFMPCCRRKVNFDFQRLGWDHWVVAPTSFDSYYCLGRCTSFGGFAAENTDGASFYAELMNIQRRTKSLGLSACCSPVKFSPITITVMVDENEQMTQALEDVIVTQCGCM